MMLIRSLRTPAPASKISDFFNLRGRTELNRERPLISEWRDLFYVIRSQCDKRAASGGNLTGGAGFIALWSIDPSSPELFEEINFALRWQIDEGQLSNVLT